MDSPGVFAKFPNASRAVLGRGKMHVCELGDRMPQRIVHLSQRTVAAMHMRHDPTGDMSRAGRSERFDAVADDEDNVAAKEFVSLRQAGKRQAGALGGRCLTCGM